MMFHEDAHYLSDHCRDLCRICVVGDCHDELEVLHLRRLDFRTCFALQHCDYLGIPMLSRHLAGPPLPRIRRIPITFHAATASADARVPHSRPQSKTPLEFRALQTTPETDPDDKDCRTAPIRQWEFPSTIHRNSPNPPQNASPDHAPRPSLA